VAWPDVILGDTIGVAGPATSEKSSWFYRSPLGTLLGSCSAPEEPAWAAAHRLSPHLIPRPPKEDLSVCKGAL